MKLFTLLATIMITITSCNCQKKKLENANFVPPVVTETDQPSKQSDVPTIYYDATTRGFFLAIKIENKTLYISRDRDFKEYSDKKTISDKDWTEISALAKAVDLEKVKDLKWPTEKRHYDGAAHANIIFESKGVKYPANGFDHGFPPVEIETLVNKITKLAEQE